MSDGSEEDLSAVAWPGFVDILSAVIIMFVFFVMIIALSLYDHMETYKAKVIVEITEKVQGGIESTKTTEKAESTEDETTDFAFDAVKALEKKIKVMEQEKEVLERVVSQYEEEFYQARSEFEETENQVITDLPAENSLIIFFDRESITLTPESQTELEVALARYREKFAGRPFNVELETSINPGFKVENSARQLSVARMFNVRNVFLDQEFNAQDIKPNLVPGYEIDENFNWVKVIFKGAQ